jgi:hypothetical protein
VITGSGVAGFEPLGSVITSTEVAGFDPRSVITGSEVAGFGGAPPRPRIAILAARRYSLAVSRRTPVSRWIRRSVQPSRPSASTCCRLSSLKTLAIPAAEPWVRRLRQRPASDLQWPVFR